MPTVTVSPNMSLPIPVVGSDEGPDWANNLNASLTLIDAHDHTPGNGVLITPSAININADLPLNGYSLTTLLKASFTSQSAALSGTNFLSFVGGNLYVNDSSGNQIPITSGGGVAGSPGSIGSLTAPASASYNSGSKTFTWSADSGKAAAMDNGAVTFRRTNVASSYGITLQVPSSIAADYSLTLPLGLPTSAGFLTIDTSGNIDSQTYVYDVIWSPTLSVPTGSISSSTITSTYVVMGNSIFYQVAGSIAFSSTPQYFTFTLPGNAQRDSSLGSGMQNSGSGTYGTSQKALMVTVHRTDSTHVDLTKGDVFNYDGSSFSASTTYRFAISGLYRYL